MHTEQLKIHAPEDWQPFDEVYAAFAEANPMLKLNPSEYAAVRLRQQYGPALIAAGAAMKLQNRSWLASPQRFAPALWRAMSQRSLAIVQRAGARPAPAPDPGPASAEPSSSEPLAP